MSPNPLMVQMSAAARSPISGVTMGRQLEDVLAPGDPDMYSAANPVQATTTTLNELQVFLQPVQKQRAGNLAARLD